MKMLSRSAAPLTLVTTLIVVVILVLWGIIESIEASPQRFRRRTREIKESDAPSVVKIQRSDMVHPWGGGEGIPIVYSTTSSSSPAPGSKSLQKRSGEQPRQPPVRSSNGAEGGVSAVEGRNATSPPAVGGSASVPVGPAASDAIGSLLSFAGSEFLKFLQPKPGKSNDLSGAPSETSALIDNLRPRVNSTRGVGGNPGLPKMATPKILRSADEGGFDYDVSGNGEDESSSSSTEKPAATTTEAASTEAPQSSVDSSSSSSDIFGPLLKQFGPVVMNTLLSSTKDSSSSSSSSNPLASIMSAVLSSGSPPASQPPQSGGAQFWFQVFEPVIRQVIPVVVRTFVNEVIAPRAADINGFISTGLGNVFRNFNSLLSQVVPAIFPPPAPALGGPSPAPGPVPSDFRKQYQYAEFDGGPAQPPQPPPGQDAFGGPALVSPYYAPPPPGGEDYYRSPYPASVPGSYRDFDFGPQQQQVAAPSFPSFAGPAPRPSFGPTYPISGAGFARNSFPDDGAAALDPTPERQPQIRLRPNSDHAADEPPHELSAVPAPDRESEPPSPPKPDAADASTNVQSSSEHSEPQKEWEPPKIGVKWFTTSRFPDRRKSGQQQAAAAPAVNR